MHDCYGDKVTGIAFAAGPHYYEFLVPGTPSLTSFDITAASYAKNDGERRFYVTQTYNGYPDGRPIFYSAFNTAGTARTSYSIKMTSNNFTDNAEYYSSTSINPNGGTPFRLGARADGSGTEVGRVEGRWHP